MEINYHEHSKKTRKRQRSVQKQEQKNSKLRKDRQKEAEDGSQAAGSKPLFPAIQLLHDPQRIAEQVP